MARQMAMCRKFLQRLQEGISSNLARYSEDGAWVEEFADGEPWELETPFKPPKKLNLVHRQGRDLYDLENAIQLHKAFPELTPVQARDPRFWTHLTHVELWEYMRSRWPVDGKEGKEAYIKEHYFIGQSQSRALTRNGAARLWWFAHLTYDPTRRNPYELTGVLLELQDIQQTLIERNLGRIKNLRVAFLDFLLKNKNECLHNGNRSRKLVRHLAMALNMRGGVCLLDFLNSEMIWEFLESEKKSFLDAQS